MTQPFHHKASVQVAIVGALAVLITTAATIMHQRSSLSIDNDNLRRRLSDESSKVRELEIELLPFRTLAIQKYAASDTTALKLLADSMATLQEEYSKSLVQISLLHDQIKLIDSKASARTISPIVGSNIVEYLKPYVRGTVSVHADWLNTEANNYAMQIESLLLSAKYDIKRYYQGGTDLILSIGAPGSFMIINNSNAPPPHAGPIQNAFNREGLQLSGLINSNIATDTNMIVIWVGQKP